MHNDKTALIEEFLSEFDKLSPDDKPVMLAFMKLIKGELPSDPRMILRMNRDCHFVGITGTALPQMQQGGGVVLCLDSKHGYFFRRLHDTYSCISSSVLK